MRRFCKKQRIAEIEIIVLIFTFFLLTISKLPTIVWLATTSARHSRTKFEKIVSILSPAIVVDDAEKMLMITVRASITPSPTILLRDFFF